MDVFPQLDTNRLKLRRITVDDIPSLVKYANNKKIAGRVSNIPHPYQEADAIFRITYVHQGFKNKTRYVFAIILKETAGLIGEISLHLDSETIAQLGYWVGEPFWSHGFATEATKAMLQFGFEKLNLDMIYAECHIENKASQKVLVNNGMTSHGVNETVVQYRLQRQQRIESEFTIDHPPFSAT